LQFNIHFAEYNIRIIIIFSSKKIIFAGTSHSHSIF
jgi:hypothetical protein